MPHTFCLIKQGKSGNIKIQIFAFLWIRMKTMPIAAHTLFHTESNSSRSSGSWMHSSSKTSATNVGIRWTKLKLSSQKICYYHANFHISTNLQSLTPIKTLSTRDYLRRRYEVSYQYTYVSALGTSSTELVKSLAPSLFQMNGLSTT